MSRFLVRLALGTGICISFPGAIPAAEQETSARPLPSAGQSRILAALDQSTEFDFRERPLGDVVNYFKQRHEIEIEFDRKALDRRVLGEAGVGIDTPVTQSLKGITLRSALRLLLMQLDLTYVLGDGYLLITNKTEAESKLSMKVYPVADLVTLDSDFRPAPSESDDAGSFPGLLRLGGTRAEPDRAGDFPGLIDMITSTVSPESWDETGGPGTISENRNSQVIAVSQTDAVHEDIVALLAALRRVRDVQIAAANPFDPAASPETPKRKMPLKVRGYRLMRGPKSPGKSGWRPPLGVAGDASPPRNAPAAAGKPEAPTEPPGAQGGATKDVPATDAAPAKEAAPAAGAADQGGPAKPSRIEAWAEMIARVVPEVIEPNSWEPVGEGMIRAVGEGVVVRHSEEVQHRVARLMAELLPDYVPVDVAGPWGPWRAALEADPTALPRLSPATRGDWPQKAESLTGDDDARVNEALLEKCAVEFDQVPLIDALSRLADEHRVQLYIDHKALVDAGVGTDMPVTHSVKGLSYATALRLLLDELNLAYVVRDEVLVITTKVCEETLLTYEVYPVFDLVIRPPDAPLSRPGLDFQSLIDNIMSVVNPESWDESGGPATIQSFTNSGALVIGQTTRAHQDIAEYLSALREANR